MISKFDFEFIFIDESDDDTFNQLFNFKRK